MGARLLPSSAWQTTQGPGEVAREARGLRPAQRRWLRRWLRGRSAWAWFAFVPWQEAFSWRALEDRRIPPHEQMRRKLDRACKAARDYRTRCPKRYRPGPRPWPSPARSSAAPTDWRAAPRTTSRKWRSSGAPTPAKSSTLNRLCGRAGGKRALARVSKTPGRTRLINFFAVEGGGRLVDLPGYGFASASKAERDAWSRAIDDYLHERSGLRLVVVVMDARRPLQPMDRAMIEWCMDQDLPVLALLNKADKLKAGARKRMLREVRAAPGGTGAELFSAVTGLGVEAVLGTIRGALSSGKLEGTPPVETGEDAHAVERSSTRAGTSPAPSPQGGVTGRPECPVSLARCREVVDFAFPIVAGFLSAADEVEADLAASGELAAIRVFADVGVGDAGNGEVLQRRGAGVGEPCGRSRAGLAAPQGHRRRQRHGNGRRIGIRLRRRGSRTSRRVAWWTWQGQAALPGGTSMIARTEFW